MRMRIDQPRHDPLSGRVDDLHVVPVFKPDIAGEAPGAFDAITLDHNGFTPEWRIPRAVDQGSVGDHNGSFTLGAHLTLPLFSQSSNGSAHKPPTSRPNRVPQP